MNEVLKVLLLCILCVGLIAGGVFFYQKYPNVFGLLQQPVHIEETPKPEKVHSNDTNEVFHVAGEMVDYKSAEGVCKQYGAKLATYDQLVDAYKDGAEWCNYGWTENQTAYYPTQKETWKRIQNAGTEEERSMCGVPGLNGGTFDKHMKFGVNCFGLRPDKPDPYFEHPKLPSKKEMKYFDDLVVVPYSRKKWSRDDYEPAQV